MSTSRSQSRSRGQEPDWQEGLYNRLRELGYDSFAAFFSDRPLSTFGELAEELESNRFAQVQLYWVLLKEAEKTSSEWECALHMLVRFLRAVPGGWKRDRDDEEVSVIDDLIAWQSVLPARMHDHCRQVMSSIANDDAIPSGWVPSGVDDPYLRPHLSQWPTDGLVEDNMP